jgi:hypothetical protein
MTGSVQNMPFIDGLGTDSKWHLYRKKRRSIRQLARTGTDGTDLFKVSPVTRAHGDNLKMGSDLYHLYHRSYRYEFSRLRRVQKRRHRNHCSLERLE